MRKGEQTKLRIIEKAAVLFNDKGYTGTTMQDTTLLFKVEGAIMASRLTRDNKHVSYAMQNIERLLMTYKVQ